MLWSLGNGSFLESISHFMQRSVPKITSVLLSLRLLDIKTTHSCRFHVQIATRYQSFVWGDSWFLHLKAGMRIASALCLVFIKVFDICVLKIEDFPDAFLLLVQKWWYLTFTSDGCSICSLPANFCLGKGKWSSNKHRNRKQDKFSLQCFTT